MLLLGRVLKLKQQRLGIPLVMERLHRGDGFLPWRNTVHQFVGGYLALSCGFAVGREGPVIHLGAAASAALGRLLRVSPEMTRLLSASGACAAIALVFSTPLAAVAFVMEVLLRRWRWDWLPALLLAATVGLLVHDHLVQGSAELRHWMDISAAPALSQWPLLLLMGLGLGGMAYLFNLLLLATIRAASPVPAHWRFLLAALITAGVGLVLPQTLGTLGGIHNLASGEPALGLLLAALLAKFVLVIAALGLGIPGGVVGPTYALGLMLGLSCALLANTLGLGVPVDGFALLGLAAFAGAVLQAPLASLLTVMELSGNLSLMPSTVLVTLPAWLLHRYLANGQSIFVAQLKLQGVELPAAKGG